MPFSQQKIASAYFGAGRSMLLAPHLENDVHQHKLIQITFADKPFKVKIAGEDWLETKCVIIGTNVPHQVHAITGYQISQHIMPDNIRGKNLRDLLNGEKAIYPVNKNIDDWYHKFILCVNENYDCKKAFKIFDETIDLLTNSNGFEGSIDDRIFKAMEIINNKINSSISASELAESVHLSEGRFMHLFTEQLGIPLRHYILFQRITLAVKIFMQGGSLTEAALTSGFSDSAHFTRTFTAMYGIKPSTYAKLRHLYNIHYCMLLNH